jgi:hypothetical protein
MLRRSRSLSSNYRTRGSVTVLVTAFVPCGHGPLKSRAPELRDLS